MNPLRHPPPNQRSTERSDRATLTATASSQAKRKAGFTARELLVVLGVLGLLGGMLLPVLARDRTWVDRTVCLQRLRQLQRAMALYAVDANEWLPPNPDDGNTVPYHAWVGGNVSIGGANTFDPDIVKNPTRSLLIGYLAGDIDVFRCPSDDRTGLANGQSASDPAYRGHRVPAARLVSLNGAVGTNPYRPTGRYPVDGPWLDGAHTHTANKTWYCYGKVSDFARPGPAKTFTFIEEDPISINDGALGFVGPSAPQNFRLIDYPASFHDGAAAVAFADGHVEMHRWADSRTINPISAGFSQPGNPDIVWLATRASALIVR